MTYFLHYNKATKNLVDLKTTEQSSFDSFEITNEEFESIIEALNKDLVVLVDHTEQTFSFHLNETKKRKELVEWRDQELLFSDRTLAEDYQERHSIDSEKLALIYEWRNELRDLPNAYDESTDKSSFEYHISRPDFVV